MASYKKFLIQQQSYNGTSYTNVGSVVDTYATYGIVCQEFPFKYMPEPKEPAKRDWYDENGEDVYIPTDGLKLQAYDVEAKFLYAGKVNEMHTKIKGFITFLYGRNSGGSSMMAIYDEYTKIGKRGVYVAEASEDIYFYNEKAPKGIATFKVKFRVTDPVTDITLTI